MSQSASKISKTPEIGTSLLDQFELMLIKNDQFALKVENGTINKERSPPRF